MTALYAIYRSSQETTSGFDEEFIERFTAKWKDSHSPYFKVFISKNTLPENQKDYFTIIIWVIMALAAGFILGKIKPGKTNGIKNLSVQERRVFELLKKGASNQEISEEFNIGISTVKSHVSSILSKLGIKSRKDIIHMD